MHQTRTDTDKTTRVGWREWVGLPALGVDRIKAKLDTGARTSALDVESYEIFEQDGAHLVRFVMRYGTASKPKTKECVTPLREVRYVRDSGGHEHVRAVIKTPVSIGRLTRSIEVTLSKRSDMKFRMLIGRSAMKNLLIDPEHSYLTGKRKPPTSRT